MQYKICYFSKLVLFALEHKLVKRVFVSPVYTPAEQRPSQGSTTAADGDSLGLSNSGRGSDITASTQASRTTGGAATSVFTPSTVNEDLRLEQAYRLMDGNHTLEFIAAKSAMDPGELLRFVRSDPACELLLR